MSLKKVGFFRELVGGDPVGPSIYDALPAEPTPADPLVLDYLERGVLLVFSPGVVADVLNPRPAPIAALSLLTDGVWIWRSDLSSYVRTYHLALPPAFLAHIEARGYAPPRPDEIDLLALEENAFDQER